MDACVVSPSFLSHIQVGRPDIGQPTRGQRLDQGEWNALLGNRARTIVSVLIKRHWRGERLHILGRRERTLEAPWKASAVLRRTLFLRQLRDESRAHSSYNKTLLPIPLYPNHIFCEYISVDYTIKAYIPRLCKIWRQRMFHMLSTAFPTQ
jgi:hypothetical protein